MTTKVKIIIIAIVALISVASVIGVFVYINHLNNKIVDLNNVIVEQSNEIQALNCNIAALEKNVDSLHETINVTNNYISNLKEIHEHESDIKDAIYNEVTNDPDVKEWFNEQIPDNILHIINGAAVGMCQDGN